MKKRKDGYRCKFNHSTSITSTFKKPFSISKRLERDHVEVVYKRRAARPAAANKPVAPVGRAAIPDEVEEVAALPAAEVAEEALLAADEDLLAPLEVAADATEEAEDSTEEIAADALEEISEAEEAAAEDALAATEEALEAAPPPKMVVDPTVVSKVEDPLVTVETISDVVIADDPSVGLGVL